MEKEPGAYIVTEDGSLEPDLDDEAMAARQSKKTENLTKEKDHAVIK